MALYHWSTGDFAQAIACQNRDIRLMDSVHSASVHDNIEKSISSFLQSKYDNTSRRLTRAHGALVPLGLALLILIVLTVVLKRRVSRRDKIISEKMRAYQKMATLCSELRIQSEQQSEIIRQQTKHLDEIISGINASKISGIKNPVVRKTEMVKELCELFFIYKGNDDQIKNQLFRLVTNLIKEMNGRDFIKELAVYIDGHTNGVATWYRTEFPTRRKEFPVLIYSLCGLSVKEMSVVLDIKVPTLYHYRKTIRNDIQSSPLQNKDGILKQFQ